MRRSLFITGILTASVSVLCAAGAAGIDQAPAQQEQVKEEESLFVAQKAFDDGFYDVALALLDRFQKNYPASRKLAEVNLLIGQCYFHQSRFLDALNKFQELLAQPGAKAIRDAALYWTAEVHFRGNNFAKAAEYYKKIIDEHPGSAYLASAYYSVGWCFFQQRQFKDALEYFRTVEEKFPGQAQVQDASFKIIESLYNLKEYAALKERLAMYMKVYARDSAKQSYLTFYLAEADYYLDDFRGAAENYSRALASSGDAKLAALARLGLGWAQLRLKDYPAARENLFAVEPASLEAQSRGALYVGRAALYAETSMFQEAAFVYDLLIAESTDPLALIQAHLGKAEALYNQGNYKEALAAYQAAQAAVSADKTTPGELVDKLHYGLAWAYLKEGLFKEAIAEFQKIVRLTEDRIFKVSALCQIGDAYQDSGDLDRARQTYDTILREYPDSLYSDYVQYQLGLVLLKVSNYDGAIASFSLIRQNFSSSKLVDDATYALGLAHFQKQDYRASRDTFKKFEHEFSDSGLKAQALYLLGTSHYNLEEFSDAVEVFKRIIRFFSHDSELVQKAEYEIADCFYRMGNEKEALARFNALRAKYPDSNLTAEIMWWLGEYYYRANDLQLALRHFSSLIRDFPDSPVIPDAYYALGAIYAQESRFEEAVGYFNKVIGASSSDLAGQAAIAIADILVRQEQPEQAIELYKDKVRQYPNLAHLIYPKIGDILSRAGNSREALEYYQKSLDVVPLREVADIRFKIAEAYQAQGKSAQAVEEYLKVTYLFPDNKELGIKAYLRVARLYEDKEDLRAAEEVYTKLSLLEVPEAKYARERLEAIRARSKTR